MKRSLALFVGGLVTLLAGVAMVYLPAALILAGTAVAAIGLFALDVDRKARQ